MHRTFQLVSCGLLLVSAAIASEFVPPPEAERDAVAALTRHGSRVQVDGDYRVTVVSLTQENTNEDLKRLGACERLVQIQINSRNITDDGIAQLKELKSLTSITIISSGMTAEGIGALRSALPNCRITSGRDRGIGFPAATTTSGESRFGSDRGNRPVPEGTTFGTRGERTFFTPGINSASRLLNLARNVSIQDDLKLTNEQRRQVNSAADPEMINRIIDERILEALTPDQRARLKQLELQQAGIVALSRDEVAKELRLTEAQRVELVKVMDEVSASLRAATTENRTQGEETLVKLREKLQELTKQRETRMLAVLSDEQRQAWQNLLGPEGPPAVGSAPARTSGFNFTSIADLSRSLFTRYDTDQDGMLSEAEFPSTNRTRQAMTRAGEVLVFPLKREDFEKAYTRYVESLRAR